MENDCYKTTRIMYIIEAALEYFISLGVGTVYLAKITTSIGISDAVTGIITAFVSLGCGFQIFAVFLANKKPVKGWVTLGHIVSQVLFSFIYLIPVFKLSVAVKTVVFIAVILIAYFIHNVINAPKINWFMSTVDNNKRGDFTAKKEIISLISGMAFSYLMGAIMDKFEAEGNLGMAFITGGVVMFITTALHTLTLLFSKEKEDTESSENKSNFKVLLKDKTLLKIILVSVLWNMASYATNSFSGTYKNNELAFSLTFSSVIAIIGSGVRVIFSIPLGKYADKKNFSSMLIICFFIALIGYVVNIFTRPENGKVVYTVYYMLNCISMAGINSATINLIYDYVSKEDVVGALALKSSIAGVAGFLTPVALSALMAKISENGNTLFGISGYSQQFFSVISALIVVVLIIYMFFVIKKLPCVNKQDN